MYSGNSGNWAQTDANRQTMRVSRETLRFTAFIASAVTCVLLKLHFGIKFREKQHSLLLNTKADMPSHLTNLFIVQEQSTLHAFYTLASSQQIEEIIEISAECHRRNGGRCLSDSLGEACSH